MARVTLKDVARASGVSTATVSFVLNEKPGQTIPAETRARVREAADSLGYVPHGIARALREGTSRIVLLNAGRLRQGGSLQSFIGGLEAELAERGHTLLVRYGAGEASATALRRVVDAANPRAVIDLEQIYADDDSDLRDGGWHDGMAAHTDSQIGYLADRGHTRIAFAAPADPGLARFVALRLRHVRASAAMRGLPPPEMLTDSSAATAVAAFDDDTALRVLAALADRQLSVPGEVAVIGFDDTPHGALWRPALTTVHIDAAGYGRRAGRMALGLDAGVVLPNPSTVIRRASA